MISRSTIKGDIRKEYQKVVQANQKANQKVSRKVLTQKNQRKKSMEEYLCRKAINPLRLTHTGKKQRKLNRSA